MYIAALDIGGTKTIVAICDEKGQVCEKKVFPTVVSNSDLHLDNCVLAFRNLFSRMGINAPSIIGIGVSLPGVVNSEEGVLLYAPYSRWRNVRIAEYLSKKLNIDKVVCENDVNACAIGEQIFGVGRKYKDFIWITVSTGIGGAVVVNSELVKGTQGFAGELGHLKVEYTNPARCSCGQYGCMEAHASGTAITNVIQQKIKNEPAFAGLFSATSVEQNGIGCEKLARTGNEDALRIFEQVGIYLGRGISYCVNILNTQAVIIGGGVAESLDLMLPGIQVAVKKNVFEKVQDFEVVKTPLGYEAALLGAVALVIQAKESL